MTPSLPDFSRVTVAVVGDVMLDRYIFGDVRRISPEAPVPVVAVRRRSDSLGGAANVAANLRGLGCRALLLGVRGADPEGARLAELLADWGVEDRMLTLRGRPTTSKTRILAQRQQVARIDDESGDELSPAEAEALVDSLRAALPELGAVILSDYAKGVLGAEVCRRVVAACRTAGVPVLADPKDRDWTRYAGPDWLTPNLKEFGEAAVPAGLAGLPLAEAAPRLMAAAGVGRLLVTQSAEGMTLFAPDAPPDHVGAQSLEVFDVSGAGDTVIATLAAALAAGQSPGQAMRLANAAAGVVVRKIGTQPVLRHELAAALDAGACRPAKTLPRDEARAACAAWRMAGKQVVFTNGFFDLLHAGHIRMLQKARALGDKLVVGINSDASVRRQRGAGRPYLSADERSAVLSALESVDLVVVFDEDTPEPLLAELTPDVLAKGADYTVDTVVGHELVETWGGRVELIAIDGPATADIVERIKRGG